MKNRCQARIRGDRRWLALLFAGPLLWWPTMTAAQPEASGGPAAMGKDSAGGATQSDALPEKARGTPMRDAKAIEENAAGEGPEPQADVLRTIESNRRKPDMKAVLEERDRKGSAPVKGELPSFEEARKVDPEKERVDPPRPGTQGAEPPRGDRGARDAVHGKKHLRVVLQLRADGTTEVLGATEFAEGAPLSEFPSTDYIWEVSKGGRTIAAEATTVDPFEIHSFGAPEDFERGEYKERVEEATIVVLAPDVGINDSLDDLDVELHKLERGLPIWAVNAEVLDKLKKEKRLKSVRAAKGRDLARGIRDKGKKAKGNPAP